MDGTSREAKTFLDAVDILKKGDEPGHEFRGNQYSQGGGGGGKGSAMPSARAMAADAKAANEKAKGSASQQAKDKAADAKANEKFSGETKAAHDALTSSGYTRDPSNDIRGREGMRAYTNSKGDKVLQSSGLAVHTSAGGKKTVMNSSKQLKSFLGRHK